MKTHKITKFLTALLLTASTLCTMSSVQANTHALDKQQMSQHLKMFEKIAKSSGGSRAMGTEGGITTGKYIDDYLNHPALTLIGLPFETSKGEEGQNILVTVPGKLDKDIIMIGTYYDSAKGRVGLNDNGSGVAVILELIQHYAQAANQPKNTLLFVLWDGHYAGMAGVQSLAAELPVQEMGNIHAYINLNQVGSKNPTVYIATNSAKQHTQDAWLEKQLSDFFKRKAQDVKTDNAALAQTEAKSFVGQMAVTSFSFTNPTANPVNTCQGVSCDQLGQIDLSSMQLAGYAVQHLIQQLDQTVR